MRFVLLAAALLAAAPASAITYVGNRNVGAATVSLSITTDGTLGVLSQANIVNWTIKVSNGMESGTFVPGAGNRFTLLGSALSATATQLSFDFGAASSVIVFGNTENGPPGKYLCIDTGLLCIGSSGANPALYVDTFANSTDFYSAPGQGVDVLATVASNGVPEPASWAMLIAGFGLTGAVARRRKMAVIAA